MRISDWSSDVCSSDLGAGRGLLGPASIGALAACALVLLVGAVVHRPLSRVPENTLKFGVGVMLSAFGVYWTGEGLDIEWPGGDLALLVFAALFLATGLLAARPDRQSRVLGKRWSVRVELG